MFSVVVPNKLIFNNINFPNCIKLLIIKRFYRKSDKFNLLRNNELEEIVIGLMLGDLFAEKIN